MKFLVNAQLPTALCSIFDELFKEAVKFIADYEHLLLCNSCQKKWYIISIRREQM